jgi:hypothetical protein
MVLMLSIPPTSTTFASSHRIIWEAVIRAFMEEGHALFTVCTWVPAVRPAFRAAVRPGLGPLPA